MRLIGEVIRDQACSLVVCWYQSLVDQVSALTCRKASGPRQIVMGI